MVQEQNRRRFNRISFGGEAYLSLPGDSERKVDLIDLSLHGALIKADQHYAMDETRYQLRVPLGAGLDIFLEVTVVRVADGTIGLQVEQMDIESAQHLRRLVELNLGNETLLNRNLAALFKV
ncbi:PilZ domain-containing protein [Thiorhodospira sibirica]|uniref:PilZ domain-containing protein n=1 Tax=Thiorhodospira sibirica TaxID=154347 RepID=UPI00022C1708|nr:PilZ domain-containing protein [Thiorhodospira sibirica]